ncbi:MAG: hypothetical protein HY438_01325 [DPANN group archaeon]|nr:hypothetical protein [DPANN group archaeon]
MTSYKNILGTVNTARNLEFENKSNSQQACAEILNRRQASSVLDYGAGPMDIKKKGWLNNSITYVPYDPDTKREGAVRRLPDGQFDWVICNQVVEHLTLKEIEEFMDYCAKHTNNIVISTPNINHLNWYDFHTQITHITPLYWRHFASFVESHGFSVDKIIFAMPFRNPLKKLLCRLFGSFPYNEYLIVARKL